MPDTQPSILVEGLAKSYGDFKALDGISFKIQPGEIVGFLGPNGAGKTTTMKILTCFMAASSGTAKIAGLDVYEESEQVRKKIGYLPESVPLYDDMIVYDYLEYVAELRGVAREKRKAAIKRAAELTGLTHMINRDIHELSKGYRQRVGLAQAIIHEPDVVILDEPTSGLDPNQILEIRDLIKEIGKEKTVIFSTHILQEVSAVCDRIILINRGRIVADGTFEELSREVAKNDRGVIVGLGQSGHVSALKGLDHVNEVVEVEGRPNVYRLATEHEDEVRRAVLKWAAEKGVDLLEIRVHQPDLEETFRALTRVVPEPAKSGAGVNSEETAGAASETEKSQ
jgi:ABC-2 type transport system ATP-binding protein